MKTLSELSFDFEIILLFFVVKDFQNFVPQENPIFRQKFVQTIILTLQNQNS